MTQISTKLETNLRDINFSNETFVNNMLFMTELVVKLALNISKDFKILEKNFNLDYNFLDEIKKILEEHSRFPIYIQKDAKINREISKVICFSQKYFLFFK